MKHTKLTATFVAISALFSSVAAANTPAYDFVQLGYAAGDYADIQPFDLGGFEFEGSYDIIENVFITGKYRSAEDSVSGYKLEEQNWQAGVGYAYHYSPDLILDARLYYGEIDFKLRNSDESYSDGTHFYSVAGNARYQLNDSIELFGGLEVQKWNAGSNQKAYRAGALYAFGDSKQFSVGVEYTKFSDSEWCKLFARYSF